jgi:hypothetical protein
MPVAKRHCITEHHKQNWNCNSLSLSSAMPFEPANSTVCTTNTKLRKQNVHGAGVVPGFANNRQPPPQLVLESQPAQGCKLNETVARYSKLALDVGIQWGSCDSVVFQHPTIGAGIQLNLIIAYCVLSLACCAEDARKNLQKQQKQKPARANNQKCKDLGAQCMHMHDSPNLPQ